MNATYIILSLLEAAAGVLLITGFIFEDRIAALEQKIFKKIFKGVKNWLYYF